MGLRDTHIPPEAHLAFRRASGELDGLRTALAWAMIPFTREEADCFEALIEAEHARASAKVMELLHAYRRKELSLEAVTRCLVELTKGPAFLARVGLGAANEVE